VQPCAKMHELSCWLVCQGKQLSCWLVCQGKQGSPDSDTARTCLFTRLLKQTKVRQPIADRIALLEKETIAAAQKHPTARQSITQAGLDSAADAQNECPVHALNQIKAMLQVFTRASFVAQLLPGANAGVSGAPSGDPQPGCVDTTCAKHDEPGAARDLALLQLKEIQRILRRAGC
jgi:hypothetical protein